MQILSATILKNNMIFKKKVNNSSLVFFPEIVDKIFRPDTLKLFPIGKKVNLKILKFKKYLYLMESTQ